MFYRYGPSFLLVLALQCLCYKWSWAYFCKNTWALSVRSYSSFSMCSYFVDNAVGVRDSFFLISSYGFKNFFIYLKQKGRFAQLAGGVDLLVWPSGLILFEILTFWNFKRFNFFVLNSKSKNFNRNFAVFKHFSSEFTILKDITEAQKVINNIHDGCTKEIESPKKQTRKDKYILKSF